MKIKITKSWVRKRNIFLLLLLLIIAGLFLITRTLNSPAVGVINQQQNIKKSFKQKTQTTKNYSGKYINFNYPGSYEAVSSKLSGNYLEVAVFTGNLGSSKQLTAGVLREALSDDSGVSFRRQHTNLYREDKLAGGAVVFTKKSDGFERTVFIPHADLVASISITDPNGNDLTSESQQVVQSLHWK